VKNDKSHKGMEWRASHLGSDCIKMAIVGYLVFGNDPSAHTVERYMYDDMTPHPRILQHLSYLNS
jgi:predicted secreted protein